jgi:hypothetical protein
MHTRENKLKCCVIALVTAMTLCGSMVALAAPASALSYWDPLTSSYVNITNGTGSFAGVSSDYKKLTVDAGTELNGSVTMKAMNGLKTLLAPMIATPNWGDPSTSYWTVNRSIAPCVSSVVAVNISLTVPERPGTYYIIFAFNAEHNGSQVASCTNWRYAENNSDSVVWNDGNDVAALSTAQIVELQTIGRTTVDYRFEAWWQEWTLPGDAITVVVVEPPPVPGTISGLVTDINSEPMPNVTVTLNTGESTVTAADGSFSMNLTEDVELITLSKCGYQDMVVVVAIDQYQVADLGRYTLQSDEGSSPSTLDQLPVPLVAVIIIALIHIVVLRKRR